MNHKKWNHDFPNVPDCVHQSVLNTLAGLEEQEDKKMKKRKKYTLIMLAAAMIAVLGTTVAAAELFKWNEKATDIFEAEPAQQDKLVMEQIAQEGYQTVTDNGLTITAIQTIQDSNCFYALFEVTAQDSSLIIDSNWGMDYKVDYQGTEDPFDAMTWGFVGDDRQEPGNSRYFEIFGSKMEESTEDLGMNLHFTALTGPGEKAMDGKAMIEGNWDFALTIHPARTVCYDLNKEFQIAGCPVFVESVEFSPLTGKLICRGTDIKELEQKEGVNLDQLDVLRPMLIDSIRYQDGTVVDEKDSTDMREGLDEGGSYVKVVRFEHVIEPEKASALILGEQMDEIILQ